MPRHTGPSVLVIGGGPGGLCLAQGLKRHGFAVSLVERDAARTDYLQGFRLRIRERGDQALRTCLSDAAYRAYTASLGRAPTQLRACDEHLQPLPDADPLPAGDDLQLERSVSRITLRQILLDGLDEVLVTGRRFQRYSMGPDGRPVAHFVDGGSASADLLVGADGANSAVRHQLLPHARWVDSGARRIGGKIELTAATRQRLAPALLDRTTTVKTCSGLNVFITVHEQGDGPHTPYSGNDAAAHQHPGLLFDNTSDYLFWAFSAFAPPLPTDAELARLGCGGQLAWVQRAAEQWHPDLRQMFLLTDPATVGVLPIRSSLPVGAWPTQRVTLLGDALHSMTHFRALGANSALHDARLLLQALLSVRDGGPLLLEAVGDYEATMRRDGFEAVRASLRAFQHAMDSSTSPADWAAVSR